MPGKENFLKYTHTQAQTHAEQRPYKALVDKVNDIKDKNFLIKRYQEWNEKKIHK